MNYSRATPVSTFSAILQILALVPGPQGDALRKAHAESAARSSDHNLDWMPHDELNAAGQNPVLQLNVMNIKPEDFKNCRTNEDGLIVVYDGITMFTGCTNAHVRDTFRFVKSRISHIRTWGACARARALIAPVVFLCFHHPTQDALAAVSIGCGQIGPLGPASSCITGSLEVVP